MENGYSRPDVLNCTNCNHHLYDHSFANPKSLTRQERKQGSIPWICTKDNCGCSEFVPKK